MDELITRLKLAQQPLDKEKMVQSELIDKEVDLLLKFIRKIYPYTTKKTIHGKESVLIYVYEDNSYDTMDSEVYLHPDGYVTYKIIDEKLYRGFVPDAEIINGYVKVRVDYFLKHKPLSQIIKFFDERPSALREQTYLLNKKNEGRKQFIDEFEKKLEEL